MILTTIGYNLNSIVISILFHLFITESLFSLYASFSLPELSHCSHLCIWTYHSLGVEAGYSLVREKNYAARISMEWLLDWFQRPSTAAPNLQD
jgi:hypothetical protein